MKRRIKQPSTVRAKGWKGEIPLALLSLLVLAAGLAAYSNTFGCSFHFDDETSIVSNPAIRDLANLHQIFGYSPTRFVTYLTFALNYAIGGLDVVGFHIVNLLIHLLAAVLAGVLAKQILESPAMRQTDLAKTGTLVPIFTALLFVLHPAQTQAVTYIAQRAASLAALFYLGAIVCYGRARLLQISRAPATRTAVFFTLAGLCGLAGLFAKETALTLPIALIMYELFFISGIRRKGWIAVGAALLLFAAIPSFLIIRGMVDLRVEGALPVWQYLLTQPRVLITYVRLLFFPVGQNLDYDFLPSQSLFEMETLAGIALVAGLIYLAFRFYKHSRLLSFGIVWFLLTLLPESSILPLPDVIYEHRLYLPLFGFALVVASILSRLPMARRAMPRYAFPSILFLVLGLASYERNKVWKDDLTLWNDVVSKSPDKARPFNNRGRAYLKRNMYEASLADFNRALSINPNFGDAYANRGTVFLYRGDLSRAVEDYQRALAVGVTYVSNRAETLYNLGLAYSRNGDQVRAIEHYSEAIRSNPDEPTYYYNRAISYESMNQIEKSLQDYTKAMALRPAYAKAHNNRGLLYAKLGKPDSALSDFGAAIKSDPDFLPAYLNRANVLVNRSSFDLALNDLSDALRIERKSPDLYLRRAKVFLQMRSFEKAVDDLNSAVNLDPWRGELYHVRGTALKSLGRQKDADADFQRAVGLGFVKEGEGDGSGSK